MSETAVRSFDKAAQALRGAMEDGDFDTIAEAFTDFSAALDTVRGIDAWRTDDVLKQTLRDIMARLDSDQKLARLLGDLTQQRLDRLAGTTAAATAPVTYGRRR